MHMREEIADSMDFLKSKRNTTDLTGGEAIVSVGKNTEGKDQ